MNVHLKRLSIGICLTENAGVITLFRSIKIYIKYVHKNKKEGMNTF